MFAAIARDPEAAAAMLRMLANNTDTTTAKIYGDAERRRLFPWRASYEQAVEFFYFIASHVTVESSTTKMVELCKEALLSEEDVMSLTYTLFTPGVPMLKNAVAVSAPASSADRLVYATILLTKRGRDRVLAHNWWVAKFLGESFLQENGAKIERLNFPLFPPLPEFEGLNLKLLFTVTNVSGGTSDVDAAEMLSAGASFYARDSSVSHAPHPAPRPTRRPTTAHGGNIPFPVVDSSGTPHGQAYVDMQTVADAVNALRADSARLCQRVSFIEGARPTGLQSGTTFADPAATSPTRSRRGRGRGDRSRARGRASAAGDDEAEKPTNF
jgi:hypothetical protein